MIQPPQCMSLDCPDTCMTVTVEDGRLLKVHGSRVNPLTRGAVCAKVTHYPELVHGPDRLLTPLQRVGGKGEGRFAPISWEQALELIYTRFTAIMQEFGPQAILPLNYAGPHGFLAGGSMDLRFFINLAPHAWHVAPVWRGERGGLCRHLRGRTADAARARLGASDYCLGQ